MQVNNGFSGLYDKIDLQTIREHRGRTADLSGVSKHTRDERLRYAVYALFLYRGTGRSPA